MHGYATFPGVNAVIDAEISVIQGISPSVCTMHIAPQAELLREGGTLAFYFGDRSITWTNCKVDYASMERDQGGMIWQLRILDRRWKWRFGKISGAYNLRNADNTVRSDTEKNPQELAELCLAAMGEYSYDVSGLPIEPRPFIDWNVTNPAEALAALCDTLNCRVVLSLANEMVKIVKVGTGADLPNGPITQGGETIDSPEMPSQIAIVTAPVRYQCDFMLEAVGLDTDGKIKAIDSLSYKPPGGWGIEAVEDGEFYNVLDKKGKREQALARQSVYRWYRILDSFQVPGYGLIEDRRQVLPLFDELAETILQTDPSDNTKKFINRPSLVYGGWCPYPDGAAAGLPNISSTLVPPPTATVDENDSIYLRPYTLDTELGIVKFNDPVFYNLNPGEGKQLQISPAQLYLRTSCNIKYKDTNSHIHYYYSRNTGGSFNTLPQYINRSEIQLNVIPVYGSSGSYTLTYNYEDVNEECEYWLDAAMREYQTARPETRRYAGMIQQDLDGAIRQVTYTVGPAGTYTTISRNDEQLSRTLPYEYRRRKEREQAAKRTGSLEDIITRYWNARTDIPRWDNGKGRWVR